MSAGCVGEGLDVLERSLPRVISRPTAQSHHADRFDEAGEQDGGHVGQSRYGHRPQIVVRRLAVSRGPERSGSLRRQLDH
jgi:hypothetical protein